MRWLVAVRGLPLACHPPVLVCTWVRRLPGARPPRSYSSLPPHPTSSDACCVLTLAPRRRGRAAKVFTIETAKLLADPRRQLDMGEEEVAAEEQM